MIIYPNNKTIEDIRTSFKWMFEPKSNTYLISRGRNQHKYILHEYSLNNEAEPFDNWIRFIHLEEEDFRTINKSRILCVRPYNEIFLHKEYLFCFIRNLGIESPIMFDMTNSMLKQITKNYNENY